MLPRPSAALNPGGVLSSAGAVRVRVPQPRDIPELVELSRATYGRKGAWKTHELEAHQEYFPEGQLVADDPRTGRVVGMAVSLVIDSSAWPRTTPWRKVTGEGTLSTHDPAGDLLYGAGLAVDPESRGMGVARALYRSREELLKRLGLSTIRAGARIPGYRRVANEMSVEAYVDRVVKGRLVDPTLSFHLHMGFRVAAVAREYLLIDAASLTHAAIVEWGPPRDAPERNSAPSTHRIGAALTGRDG